MNDITLLLTAMLGRLCRAVGAHLAAQAAGPQLVWLGTQAFIPTPNPNQPTSLPTETWHLLTQRLGRLAHRFRTLFARYQAGTLPKPRPPRAPSAQPAAPRAPYPRLPAARGWINARVPDAAPCAGTLDILLQTPEMQDFVHAAPQAGRILRPLCRMLGLTAPGYLRLPPRPRPARRAAPPAPARREPEGGSCAAQQPHQGTPDRPIPKYILAAVRAWRAKTR